MTKQSLPAVSPLTADTIKEFQASDRVVVVAYVASSDKTSNATFTEVANALRTQHVIIAAANQRGPTDRRRAHDVGAGGASLE